MTESNFTVKNGLVVNTSFTANSTVLQANGLIVNSTLANVAGGLTSANLTTQNIGVGANIQLTTTQLFVGNSTANLIANSTQVRLANSTNTTTLSPVSLSVGTTVVNTTTISAGVFTANNTLVNAAAVNITGQVNTATFFATTSANVGANVQLTTSQLFIGNATVNATVNSTAFSGRANTANTLVNTDGVGIDPLYLPRAIDLGTAAFVDIDALYQIRASNTTTARSLQSREADIINVLDFGAVSDAQTAYTQVTCNFGSNIIQFSNNLFTNNDVGKIVGITRVDNRKSVSFNANTAVDNTIDTIAISEQIFKVGDSALYEVNAGNTAINGLQPNSRYYVTFANTTHLKLSKSTIAPAIQISKGATETGHTLSLIKTEISFNANAAVIPATNSITLGSANQYFQNGDSVYYLVDAGNTAIGGLTANTFYYIVGANSTSVQLSTSAGGAAIALTKGATQTGHSFYRPWSPFINYTTITAVNAANSITISSSVSNLYGQQFGAIYQSNCGVVWGTDSYNGLANAFSRATTLGGGTVYVPSGNYVYGRPLYMTSNTSFVGDGPSSILYSAGHAGSQGSGTGAMITNLNGYYANGLSKKTFTSFTSTYPINQIDQNLIVRDLTFNQIGGVAGGAGKTIGFVLAKNIKIENCYLEAPTITKDFISLIGCDNIDEIGNFARGVQIMHDHWGGCSRLRIMRNVAETKYDNGLQVINLNAQGTAANDYNISQNIICSDNILVMNGGFETGGGHTAIFLDGLQIGSPTENYVIENNTIIGNSGYKNAGIIGRGAGGKFKISGNRLYNIGSTSPLLPILIGSRANNSTFTLSSNQVFTTSSSNVVIINTGTHALTNNAVDYGAWLKVPNLGTINGINFNGSGANSYLKLAYVQNTTAVAVYAPSAASSTGNGTSTNVSGYNWWYGTPRGNHITDNIIVNSPSSDSIMESSGENTIISGNIVDYDDLYVPQYESALKISSVYPSSIGHIISNNRLRAGSNTYASGSWSGDGRIAWQSTITPPLIIDYNHEANRIAVTANVFSANISANTTTVTNSRSLSDILSEVYNVKDYGAVGDGNTDDRAAIQRTIDAVYSSGKAASVYIPSGNYKIGKTANTTGIADTLATNGLITYPSVKIKGEQGSTTLLAGNSDMTIIGYRNLGTYQLASVASANVSGTTGTIVFNSAHGLTSGNSMRLIDFTPSAWNSSSLYTVTVSNTTAVTVTVPSGTANATIMGTAWYANNGVDNNGVSNFYIQDINFSSALDTSSEFYTNCTAIALVGDVAQSNATVYSPTESRIATVNLKDIYITGLRTYRNGIYLRYCAGTTINNVKIQRAFNGFVIDRCGDTDFSDCEVFNGIAWYPTILSITRSGATAPQTATITFDDKHGSRVGDQVKLHNFQTIEWNQEADVTNNLFIVTSVTDKTITFNTAAAGGIPLPIPVVGSGTIYSINNVGYKIIGGPFAYDEGVRMVNTNVNGQAIGLWVQGQEWGTAASCSWSTAFGGAAIFQGLSSTLTTANWRLSACDFSTSYTSLSGDVIVGSPTKPAVLVDENCFNILFSSCYFALSKHGAAIYGRECSIVGSYFLANFDNDILLSNTRNITVADNITSSAAATNARFNANTSVDGAADSIFLGWTNQNFANGDYVYYTVSTGNTAVSGLTGNSYYYIVGANTNVVKLSATAGGTACNITASATSENGHFLSAISSKTFSINETGSSVGNIIVGNKYSSQVTTPSRTTIWKNNANMLDEDGQSRKVRLGVGTSMVYSGFGPQYFIANSTFVNLTNETIQISAASLGGWAANDVFAVNDVIYYRAFAESGNSPIGGLANVGSYYVSFANATHIALSNTLGGANINFTSVPSGSQIQWIYPNEDKFVQFSADRVAVIGKNNQITISGKTPDITIGTITGNSTSTITGNNVVLVSYANTLITAANAGAYITGNTTAQITAQGAAGNVVISAIKNVDISSSSGNVFIYSGSGQANVYVANTISITSVTGNVDITSSRLNLVQSSRIIDLAGNTAIQSSGNVIINANNIGFFGGNTGAYLQSVTGNVNITTNSGNLYFYTGSGQANVYIANQISITSVTNTVSIVSAGNITIQPSTGIINIPGSSQLQINGTKVIGTRGAAITDAITGASATANNAANTVNLILAALRTHGLIAP